MLHIKETFEVASYTEVSVIIPSLVVVRPCRFAFFPQTTCSAFCCAKSFFIQFRYIFGAAQWEYNIEISTGK